MDELEKVDRKETRLEVFLRGVLFGVTCLFTATLAASIFSPFGAAIACIFVGLFLGTMLL